ncbi:MAG: M23 family metallopeptidase [Clostridiales bacterium]|nr:M23 family metallopeptidase [Clostridiales bacterium]
MKKIIQVILILIIVALIGTSLYLGYQIIITMNQGSALEQPISATPSSSNTPFVEKFFDQKPPIVTLTPSFGMLFISNIEQTWYQNHTQTFSLSDNTVITSLDEIITINSNKEADMITLQVFNKSDELVINDLIVDCIIPILDVQGTYTYKISMIWSDPLIGYIGRYDYEFLVDVDLPINYIFSKTTILQGDIIKLTIKNVNKDETPIINQSLFSKFTLYRDGNDYIGYLPAGYWTSVGDYIIEHGIEGQSLKTTHITVNKYPYKIQWLYIDETLAAATKNNESSAEYTKYFVPVRQQSNQDAYYTESFIIPAYGGLSTEFGENRYVNGAPTSYHHSGLDIGNEIGSPIYATNRGKVVLSMYLIMTGNTIVIDHGQGLFSVYFHMDKLYANESDMVNRGEQIGEMGTTGFSTGSHLHFTMSYFDTNIEPGFILVGEPITKENYQQYLLANND